MTDKVFHYCSTDTFQKIIFNGSLRLSALSMSNDSAEGNWIHTMLLRVIASDFGNDENLISAAGFAILGNTSFLGLGVCFSSEPDLLSQWRGYADDGFGMCIGFDREKLASIVGDEAELFAVEYNMERQKEILRDEIRTVVATVDLNEPLGVHTRFSSTFNPMRYRMKNPSFSEEKEWRIISRRQDPKQARATRDRLIPYLDLELLKEHGLITDILLGPKNTSDVGAVCQFVASHGYTGFGANRSRLTYR